MPSRVHAPSPLIGIPLAGAEVTASHEGALLPVWRTRLDAVGGQLTRGGEGVEASWTASGVEHGYNHFQVNSPVGADVSHLCLRLAAGEWRLRVRRVSVI